MAEEMIGGVADDKEFQEANRRLRIQSEEAARKAEAGAQPKTTVVIADDQELVRNGFKLILSSYDGIKVVGEARNGQEAIDRARESKPDVVLMDIRMPLMDGIEATRAITTNPDLASTHVLVLTTFDIDEYVYDALSAGASGFMLKDAEPDDIAAAIKVVHRGEALIQPSITRRLVEAFVDSRPRKARTAGSIDTLTDREREILVCVARGMTNDEIADDLVISPATVKTHLARIMSKLDAHDRAQLVVFAYENGIVKPSGMTGTV